MSMKEVKIMVVTKNKVISSLFWKLMERGGTQGVQFIVQVVLARLLLPEEYGIISLTTIFIAIANVFIQQGFGTALVQRKNIKEEEISTVFFLNLLVAFILYFIIFLISPIVAAFYEQPILTNVLRVLALSLFLGAINSVQNAIVARRMQFKRFFYSSLSGIIISGIIGIIFAYKGFGVWALVVNQILNLLISTIVLWFTVKWRPKLVFRIKEIKELFSFGWRVLCSSFIDTVYNEMYGLVIGKVYSSEMLGYYNRGQQFPKIIATNLDSSISTVMLPTLSSQQDNRNTVKNIMRRAIMTSSFLVFPTMIGLAAIAEPMVKIVLTDKWLNCVHFIQMLCISYVFLPVHTSNLQAINAIGRSDIFLKLEIIKKTLGVVFLLIGLKFGIYVLVALKIVHSLISTFINSYPNRKLLNYSFKEQMKDIMPAFILSIVMGIVVYSISFIKISNIILLIIQIIIGILFYMSLAYYFKLESFMYIVTTIKDIFNSRKQNNFYGEKKK